MNDVTSRIEFPKSTLINLYLITFGIVLNSTHFGDSRHSNPSWNSFYTAWVFFNWAIFFTGRLDREIELPSKLGITYDSLVTRDFLGHFFHRVEKNSPILI